MKKKKKKKNFGAFKCCEVDQCFHIHSCLTSQQQPDFTTAAMNAPMWIVFFAGFVFFPFCEAIAFRPQEAVCYRQQKHSVIGYNISTHHEITVDVGECTTGETLFPNHAIIKPSHDCVPHTITEERVLLYNTFILEMQKVLTCQKLPSTCQRIPRMVTYYPKTEFSRTVDVGACGGLCRDEMTCVTCVPTKNRTKAIPTPNGKRTIEVISDCSCVTPYCYRVSAFEAFPEEFIDDNGFKAIQTKLIDMGKCIDSDRCPVPEEGHMPKTFPEMFLSYPHISCTTKTTKIQSYVAVGGRQVNVSSIDTCACRDLREA